MSLSSVPSCAASALARLATRSAASSSWTAGALINYARPRNVQITDLAARGGRSISGAWRASGRTPRHQDLVEETHSRSASHRPCQGGVIRAGVQRVPRSLPGSLLQQQVVSAQALQRVRGYFSSSRGRCLSVRRGQRQVARSGSQKLAPRCVLNRHAAVRPGPQHRATVQRQLAGVAGRPRWPARVALQRQLGGRGLGSRGYRR